MRPIQPPFSGGLMDQDAPTAWVKRGAHGAGTAAAMVLKHALLLTVFLTCVTFKAEGFTPLFGPLLKSKKNPVTSSYLVTGPARRPVHSQANYDKTDPR